MNAVLLLVLCATPVTTGDELRTAMATTNDAVIIVRGRIDLEGRGISTPKSTAVIDLIGEPGAVIDFGTRFVPWGTKGEDGLEFRCRSAFIRGVTFRNYEGKGSAVRSNVTDSLHVDACTFEDISTRTWPTKTGTLAADSTEVWFGNGIGGSGDITVTATTFRRVATSDTFAHCIYPNGSGALTVTGCTFEASGQAIKTLGRMVRLGGNTYRGTAQVMTAKRGEPEWAYWVKAPTGHMTAIGETFVNATFRWPIRDRLAPDRTHIDHNHYSGLRVVENWVPWASATQPAMTFEDWQAAGFDRSSEAPK